MHEETANNLRAEHGYPTDYATIIKRLVGISMLVIPVVWLLVFISPKALYILLAVFGLVAYASVAIALLND